VHFSLFKAPVCADIVNPAARTAFVGVLLPKEELEAAAVMCVAAGTWLIVRSFMFIMPAAPLHHVFYAGVLLPKARMHLPSFKPLFSAEVCQLCQLRVLHLQVCCCRRRSLKLQLPCALLLAPG
jgi:hypothetical protein